VFSFRSFTSSLEDLASNGFLLDLQICTLYCCEVCFVVLYFRAELGYFVIVDFDLTQTS
jgi:hypothetical protein